MIRKYAAIWALAVSAIVLLPETLLAKGAVIGYAWGNTNESPVTDEQLEKLTHLMIYDMYVEPNGDIIPNTGWDSPTSTIWKNQLSTLVDRAHSKGVIVSIVISHGNNYYYNFDSATRNGTKRKNFVEKIADLVKNCQLDGVDINWECPGLDGNWIAKDDTIQIREWGQCIALLTELRAEFEELNLRDKRISIALPPTLPSASWFYPNQSSPALPFARRVWDAVDAIHLMTYDQQDWTTHSHATSAKNAIDGWAYWGNNNGCSDAASREKLFLGCAFYGYNMNANGIIWSTVQNGVTIDGKIAYKNYTPTNPTNKGDNLNDDIESKVNHCYSNPYGNYGGVMFWELAYDHPVTNPQSLLNKIWDRNEAKGGYPAVAITTQPASTTNAIKGSICSNLSVVTNKPSFDVLFQWYKNTSNSNTGGTIIQNETNASFAIPANLNTGTYYYYCVIKSGRITKTSNVAKVVVAATPSPPVISGYSLICFGSPKSFSATNWQSGNYYWDKSSNLSLSSPATNSSVTVSAASNSGNGAGWVSVKNCSGTELKRYDVWVGKPEILEIVGPINAFLREPSPYGMSILNEHHSNPTGFQFELIPLKWNETYTRGNEFTVFFSEQGTYRVVARATNSCGVGLTKTLEVFAFSNGHYYAYPNPASNTLNIEIDQVAYAKSLEQTSTAKQLKQEPMYDFRLYDKQSNIVLRAQNKGGTAQFNVSNLPTGIYYLHVYDGISEKPEIKQIMVER